MGKNFRIPAHTFPFQVGNNNTHTCANQLLGILERGQDVKANSKKGYDLERGNYKRMNISRKTEHIEHHVTT